jgi:hypothetical protein
MPNGWVIALNPSLKIVKKNMSVRSNFEKFIVDDLPFISSLSEITTSCLSLPSQTQINIQQNSFFGLCYPFQFRRISIPHKIVKFTDQHLTLDTAETSQK